MSLTKTDLLKAMLKGSSGKSVEDTDFAPNLVWRRRSSVSTPKRKFNINLDPTSESDGELEKFARVSPTFAQKTFERFNRRAHKAYDQAQEAFEHVEDYIMHVWDVVSHHSLPDWLKDNEFLVSGHRPQLNSYYECFKSIFRVHTETGNIWTHLLGCIAFIIITAYVLLEPASAELQADDRLVFTIYCTGAILCMGFSWLFHTLYCHSESVGKLFSKLDYCGISIMVMASFVPWVYYSFYCQTMHKVVYMSMTMLLGIACIYVSLKDKFSEVAFRPVRAAVFVAFGGSGVIPTAHFVANHGLYRAIQDSPVGWLLLMAAFYLCGALIYAYRIPERFWPGRFDYWGQSHQIFHVFVVAAAFVNYHAMNLLNKNLASISECALSTAY